MKVVREISIITFVIFLKEVIDYINYVRACDSITLYNLHIIYCIHMDNCELWILKDK